MNTMTKSQKRETEVKDIIKERMSQLKLFVADRATRNKYASAIASIAVDKKLQNVSAESVVKTAFEIIQLGLNPNPLFGQAYVIPFKGVAQLQVGYKGYITLLNRAGWAVRAVAVYNVDRFSIKFAGLKDDVYFEPNYDERENDNGIWVYKNLKGAIVYAQHKDGQEYSEFIPFRVLEKLRVKSQNQIAGELSNIWLEWTEEMYLAKAIKKVAKKLPLDDEKVVEATILEDEPIKLESEHTQKPQPQILNAQILPPQTSKGNEDKVSPNITKFISAGVKRNDVGEFIKFYNITNENIENIVNDAEGLKTMVNDFYKE